MQLLHTERPEEMIQHMYNIMQLKSVMLQYKTALEESLTFLFNWESIRQEVTRLCAHFEGCGSVKSETCSVFSNTQLQRGTVPFLSPSCKAYWWLCQLEPPLPLMSVWPRFSYSINTYFYKTASWQWHTSHPKNQVSVYFYGYNMASLQPSIIRHY